MKRLKALLPALLLTGMVMAQQANLSYKMEDITSPKFPKAVDISGGVCVIPLGIIEKHGPALPLGTDMYEAREIAFHAAQKEYAVVFPPYFVGQIFEANISREQLPIHMNLYGRCWKRHALSCREMV